MENYTWKDMLLDAICWAVISLIVYGLVVGVALIA